MDFDGDFDYNTTQLVLSGTKEIIHQKNSESRTWDCHGQICWYIGPTLNHHRFFSV